MAHSYQLSYTAFATSVKQSSLNTAWAAIIRDPALEAPPFNLTFVSDNVVTIGGNNQVQRAITYHDPAAGAGNPIPPDSAGAVFAGILTAWYKAAWQAGLATLLVDNGVTVI